jgi:hypothetical protein
MRSNQITIKIQRFGSDQVPDRFTPPRISKNSESYERLKIPTQIIDVYADSHNLYEALCAAFYEALAAIQEFEDLPAQGSRQHSY